MAKYELRQHIRLRSELQRSAAPPVLTMGPSVLARTHTALAPLWAHIAGR